MHGAVRYGCVVAALAACHGSPTASPDAPGADAASGGLTVRFATRQHVPGDIGNGLTIGTATLQFATLALVGDSGAGDPNTTQVNFAETWDTGEMPEEISFPDAPAGLYSKVGFEIDGFVVNDSIDIEGMVQVSGNTKAFEIHDRGLTPVSLDCHATLQPGGMTGLVIELDLANALGAIDFTQVPDLGGTLVVAPFDHQLQGFREKLSESFRLIPDQTAHGSDPRSSNAE
jgi:hypothetical protein